jgi:hypothetical protein
MKTEQVNAILAAIAEVRDRLPEPGPYVKAVIAGGGVIASPVSPYGSPATCEHTVALKGSELAAAKREALAAVLGALNGRIEGGRENHDAMGHRHENRGEECWRSFAPSDIRSMINDAARQVGLARFPDPKSGAAPEDVVGKC